jgi:hypothetical protein
MTAQPTCHDGTLPLRGGLRALMGGTLLRYRRTRECPSADGRGAN